MQQILTFIVHHWELWLALLIVLMLIVAYEVKDHLSGVAKLSTHAATQLINRENAKVIDVRSSELYSQGHILNARNIPVTDLAQQLSQLEKDKSIPIILVCGSGAQSMQAGRLLKKHGFNVYSLQGGISAWRVANLPIVKS